LNNKFNNLNIKEVHLCAFFIVNTTRFPGQSAIFDCVDG